MLLNFILLGTVILKKSVNEWNFLSQKTLKTHLSASFSSLSLSIMQSSLADKKAEKEGIERLDWCELPLIVNVFHSYQPLTRHIEGCPR